MNEEYGTLSEEELIQEIQRQLDAHPEIDASDLEFKFEDDHLHIRGSLQTDEELESLVHILEDYLDPKEYSMEVEIMEAPDPEYSERGTFRRDAEEEEEEEEYIEDDLEEFDEEEMEEEGELDEEDFDDDKW